MALVILRERYPHAYPFRVTDYFWTPGTPPSIPVFDCLDPVLTVARREAA